MSKNRARGLWLVYGIFVLGFSVYTQAFAAEIDLTTDTHFQFREDARNNNFTTLYQYIDLEATNIVDQRLSLFTSGWIRYDLDSTDDGDREDDEILYVYLSYSPFMDRRLIVNLGRHFVFEGVASEQIDGVTARWEIVPFLGVTAYGGVPVETDFDDRDSDSIVGGRLFLRLQQKAEIGFSFLKEDNDDSSYREELGVDVWLLPIPWLEVQGHSFWNNNTEGWMEHSYALRVFPTQRLTFSTLVSYTDYDDAFAHTTLSAFLPDSVRDDETMTKVGPSIEYQVNDWLTGVVDYTRYEYKHEGSADFFGIALTAYLPVPGLAAGTSIHRMDGDTERLRYTKARMYATKTFEAFKVSFDTVHLYYDDSFSGTHHAYSFNGGFTYRFTPSLVASASLDYSKNPDFDNELQAFLTIAYNFGKDI